MAAPSAFAPTSAVSTDAPPPSERAKKKLMEAVSRIDYIEVIRALNSGISPNADWQGLLPLRTAVLVGDVDMVALLRRAGADPYQEPKGKVKPEDGDEGEREERVITLGKSARALCEEMSADMANPLQREAVAMLQVIDDPEASRQRMLSLQGKLEESISGQMSSAIQNIIIFGVILVAAFFAMRYLHVTDDEGDAREL